MGKPIGAMKVQRLHEDFGEGVESEWKGMAVNLGEEGRPTFSVQSAMASLRGRSGLSSFLPSFPLIRKAKALLRFCCDRLLLMHVAPAGLAREGCREGQGRGREKSDIRNNKLLHQHVCSGIAIIKKIHQPC